MAVSFLWYSDGSHELIKVTKTEPGKHPKHSGPISASSWSLSTSRELAACEHSMGSGARPERSEHFAQTCHTRCMPFQYCNACSSHQVLDKTWHDQVFFNELTVSWHMLTQLSDIQRPQYWKKSQKDSKSLDSTSPSHASDRLLQQSHIPRSQMRIVVSSEQVTQIISSKSCANPGSRSADHIGVSRGYPKIIHFKKIVLGYPHLWKPPYLRYPLN